MCPRGQHCELTKVKCVKSPCYPMPMCKPDVVAPIGRCPAGYPLKNHFCGRGGKKCPMGYFCNSQKGGKFGVCCPACPGVPQVRPVGRCSRCKSCPGNSICTNVGGNSMCCPPGKYQVAHSDNRIRK